jgi:exoribonuclease R
VAGAPVPEWVRAALPSLAELMAGSDSVASKVTRACVDRTEAALLRSRVGEEFEVVVLRPGDPGEVYLHDPPVLARCTGRLELGATVRVRLAEADPATGRISFTAARTGT